MIYIQTNLNHSINSKFANQTLALSNKPNQSLSKDNKNRNITHHFEWGSFSYSVDQAFCFFLANLHQAKGFLADR